MTTAYALQPWNEESIPVGFRSSVVSTNTAFRQEQDEEALNLVRHITRGTAAHGQSIESAKIIEAVKKLQMEMAEYRDNLRVFINNHNDLAYQHIPAQTAFLMQATYTHIGKLKPRQFPLDE